VFVYGVCVGPTGRFERVLKPSQDRFSLGPVLVREGQRSIFDAYNSILDEAVRLWTDAEGVILLHEDLQIRGPAFEARLRATLVLPEIGVIGVIGGAGHTDNWSWNSPRKYGYVEDAACTRDFRRGTYDVDTVDGLPNAGRRRGPGRFSCLQATRLVAA
jgi:Glycosyltransferase like family